MGRETEREKKKTVEMGPLVSKTTPPISPRIQSFTTDSLKKTKFAHRNEKTQRKKTKRKQKHIQNNTVSNGHTQICIKTHVLQCD